MKSLLQSKVKISLIIMIVAALSASAVFYIAGLSAGKQNKFHYYGAPAVLLPGIKLEVIYFVPDDQAPDPRFYEVLKSKLAQAQIFHSREFKGINLLRYAIYPTPVIGKESSSFYDGADASRGNPDAIKKITNETSGRIYGKNGDLYNERFVARRQDELPVRVFAYQGVGASSGVLSIIASYDYFTKTDYAPTVVYHELLHVIGVPDSYDYATGASQSDDIMGAGREKPILETYIRNEIKRGLIF